MKLRLFFEETPRVAVAGSRGSGRMSLAASPSRTRIVQSWDVAMMTGGQNDYSACTRGSPTRMTRTYSVSTGVASNIRSCAARSSVSLRSIARPGPDRECGMNLLQDLRAAMPRGMTRPIGVKPEGSKVDRMAAQSAKTEQHETGKPLHIKGLFGF